MTPSHGNSPEVTRRAVLATGVGSATLANVAQAQQAQLATAPAPKASAANDDAQVPGMSVTLDINGRAHTLRLDPRTTLLDALREHVQLTGTKKGCDHGQCGACTVMVNDRRINSCLTLAVMHEGDKITTIEGLGRPGQLHPMQAAFVKHDGFQCGYCTPGQVCSAVATLGEIRAGIPSHVSVNLIANPKATAEEIRERMSGNICRCGAYSNILDAIQEVAGGQA
ncbi:aldehyde dehydrogenase iron-sulfur subunit [Xylophilus rhododendri]|uniref:Aldehyde dehydrogenase iron-sulfur subunit n=1 Tax=Xylophilus rhododendri TaxID=2697032 RepID=A0A857J1X4_9BURK|nr:aldehyde dehydrogenase iron-sulfur subunit PaoA [Xylophilus rhododendri]QHI97081.1 aldehyde dehydrogenase iron-sulfur subunit [Xylophilus rhododendri]